MTYTKDCIAYEWTTYEWELNSMLNMDAFEEIE